MLRKGKQPLTCLHGAEAESENQVESMPAPGAEEPQSCCPIYTLQYLPSGQGQLLSLSLMSAHCSILLHVNTSSVVTLTQSVAVNVSQVAVLFVLP